MRVLDLANIDVRVGETVWYENCEGKMSSGKASDGSPSPKKSLSTTAKKSRRLSSYHIVERTPADAVTRRLSRPDSVIGTARRLSLASASPQAFQTPRPGASEKLSREDIESIYSETIKLSQDNKINAKNTWSLNLIDYMGMLVRGPDNPTDSAPRRNTEETNFQLAGVTLDAGVRIYCSRVDSVHTNAFKVLGGLSRTTAGGGEDDDDARSDGEEGEKKVKRRARGGATLVTTLSTVTVKKLDSDLAVDPLFQKMSEAFDDGSAEGMLANRLLVASSGYILFDSAEQAAPRIETTVEDEETFDPCEEDAKFDTPKTLCPEFLSYVASKNVDIAAPSTKGVRFAPNEIEEQPEPAVAFEYDEGEFVPGPDIGAFMPAPIPAPEDDYEDAGADEADPDEFQMDAFDAAARSPQGVASLPRGGVDLVSAGVALNPNDEYSFFDASSLSSWAGPQHWQFRKPAKRKSAVPGETQSKRPRSRTAMLLDYSDDAPPLDFAAEFSKPRSATTTQLTAAVADGLSERKTTLPVDLHYATRDLTKLFLLPKLRVAIGGGDKAIVEAPGGNEGNLYDYDNEMDAENFVDEFDHDPPVNDGVPGNAIENPASAVDGLGVDLVALPERFEKLEIGYATVAKKVDVRQLKSGIWSRLCGNDKEADEVEQPVDLPESQPLPEKDIRSGASQTLSEVVGEMETFVPRTALEDVTFPYVFICLLHLANEKTLEIKASGDTLNDLVILKDKEQV